MWLFHDLVSTVWVLYFRFEKNAKNPTEGSRILKPSPRPRNFCSFWYVFVSDFWAENNLNSVSMVIQQTMFQTTDAYVVVSDTKSAHVSLLCVRCYVDYQIQLPAVNGYPCNNPKPPTILPPNHPLPSQPNQRTTKQFSIGETFHNKKRLSKSWNPIIFSR